MPMIENYNLKNYFVFPLFLFVLLFVVDTASAQNNSVFNKNPILILSGNAGDGQGEFGTTGQGDGMGPMDFVVDSNMDIWIMDVMNRRVQKFDRNGNFILEFPNKKNSSPVELAANYIKCDQSGNIFIGPLSNGQIIVINNNGEYLRSIELPNVQNEQIDFAVNSLGEIIYNRNNETISMDNKGNILNKLKNGPLVQGAHSSPYSASVIDYSGSESEKIIDSDLKKSKENVSTLNKSKLTKEDPCGVGKDILFVDPFGNLFVKTFVTTKPPYKEYISYYSQDGELIQKLEQTVEQSGRNIWGYTVYNIDKDGNFYAMEIKKLREDSKEETDERIVQAKPFLYIWKWERK
jgi:hypothetical protein